MKNVAIKNLSEFDSFLDSFSDDVISLDLKGLGIGNQGLVKLLTVIDDSKNLKKLILDDNRIDFQEYEAITSLAKFLEKNDTLTELDLSNNSVGDMSAGLLIISLNTQKSLEVLGLNNTGIIFEDDVAKEMFLGSLSHNTKLRALFLSGNGIRDDLAVKILQASSNQQLSLVTNNIAFTRSETPTLDVASSSSGGLQLTLEVDDCYRSFVGVLRAGASDQKRFYLDDTGELDLSDAEIGNDGLEKLLEILDGDSRITSLILNNSRINLEDPNSKTIGRLAKFLERSLSLKALSLNNNTIGDVAAASLIFSLNVQMNLEFLSLNNCGIAIKDESAELMILGALSNNTRLARLSLSGNGLDDEIALKLHSAGNEELLLTVDGLEYRASEYRYAKVHPIQPGYQFVQSDPRPRLAIPDEDKAELQELIARSSSLSLPNKNINDSKLEMLIDVLRGNETIRHLDLSGNQITNQGLEKLLSFLSDGFNLESLDLSNNEIDNQGVKLLFWALEGNKNLKSVSVSNHKISKILENWLHRMILLNSGYIDQALEPVKPGHIVTEAELKELESISKELSGHFSSLAGPKKHQAGDDFEKVIEDLYSLKNQNVKGLDLRNLGMGDREIEVLVEALEGNTSLEVINLANNQITDQGAKKLTELFEKNLNLKEIFLDNNQIRYEGARALIDVIRSNSLRVDVLNLKYNQISPSEIGLLKDSSGKMTTEILLSNQLQTSRDDSSASSNDRPGNQPSSASIEGVRPKVDEEHRKI